MSTPLTAAQLRAALLEKQKKALADRKKAEAEARAEEERINREIEEAERMEEERRKADEIRQEKEAEERRVKAAAAASSAMDVTETGGSKNKGKGKAKEPRSAGKVIMGGDNPCVHCLELGKDCVGVEKRGKTTKCAPCIKDKKACRMPKTVGEEDDEEAGDFQGEMSRLVKFFDEHNGLANDWLDLDQERLEVEKERLAVEKARLEVEKEIVDGQQLLMGSVDSLTEVVGALVDEVRKWRRKASGSEESDEEKVAEEVRDLEGEGDGQGEDEDEDEEMS